MVLVSHRKKFIFLKTYKTASTSVESLFERWCLPEGQWEPSHARPEVITDAGIIGARGRWVTESSKYYNHMSARDLRERLSDGVWEGYRKFTTIRNPFEKVLSWYRMAERTKRDRSLPRMLNARVKRLLGRGAPIDLVSGETDTARFCSWIRRGGVPVDRDKYFIDDTCVVDTFLRFESLADETRRLCSELDIPCDAEELPSYKRVRGKESIDLSDFFDGETERLVREAYQWELSAFGYEL